MLCHSLINSHTWNIISVTELKKSVVRCVCVDSSGILGKARGPHGTRSSSITGLGAACAVPSPSLADPFG